MRGLRWRAAHERAHDRMRGQGRRSTPMAVAVPLVLALLLTSVVQALAVAAGGSAPSGLTADAGAAGREAGRVVTPRAVSEPDTRTRINPPYTTVGEVLFHDTGSGELIFSCSGTVVGARAVLTAANCFDFAALEAGEEEVSFYLAEDALQPGSIGYIPIGVWAPPTWATDPSLDNDYALLVFADDGIGLGSGWIPMRAASFEALSGNVNPATIGYPYELGERTQWLSTGIDFSSIDSYTLTADFDTSWGQEGGPVGLPSGPEMVGMVTDVSQAQTVILRMTREIIDDLLGACEALGCELAWTDDAGGSGAPGGNTGEEPVIAPPGDNSAFQRTWERTDRPVAESRVSRTWMWGPQPNTVALLEAYTQAPGGQRRVVYYDKSRMEITNPSGDANSIWYVTNGLLVVELMSGMMQTGDGDFVERVAAQINVAGDQDDPDGPTYATFANLRTMPARANGSVITQRVSRNGIISEDPALAGMGVTSAYRVSVPGLEHQVASPFWNFMNSRGMVWQNGGFTEDQLFGDPFYATGYPVAEAYWATVRVGGTPRDVLIQCFERRCLTYTPGNPPGWDVEAGNVGSHYYLWRYGELPLLP